MPSGAVKSYSEGLLPVYWATRESISGVVAVGEKDRAGIGAQCADEPRAVVLFVAPRLLVLLDDVLLVIVDVADGDDAGLHVGAHLLLVKVEARLGLALKDALLLQAQEIFACLGVHGVRVRIDVGGKIDLRAIDVEQAPRMAGRERGGFFAVHHVVRNAGHFRDLFRRGPEPLKRFDTQHRRQRNSRRRRKRKVRR